MIRRELLLMLRDGPLRAATVLWSATLAAFVVSVYPMASSYAGMGVEIELFDGLHETMLIAGALLVPWAASRLTWRESGNRLVRRSAMHAAPAAGMLAKAAAAHAFVLALMILSLPFVIIAYRTGTVGLLTVIVGVIEATLVLCLLSSLTLHWTLRGKRFLLSVGCAYGTMIALAGGRFVLIGGIEGGGFLTIVTVLNALALHALTRRAENELVFLQP